MAKEFPEIDLGSLSDGVDTGVTPAMGKMMAEAASVVLEHNNHASGVVILVHGAAPKHFRLRWPELHPFARFAHKDLPEAAHYGAYGVAILLVKGVSQFKVVERSFKRTGCDFWLGTGDHFPFQKAAKLEVSGIINDSPRLQARLYAKIEQTKRFRRRLPACVVIVEFGMPQAIFKRSGE